MFVVLFSRSRQTPGHYLRVGHDSFFPRLANHYLVILLSLDAAEMDRLKIRLEKLVINKQIFKI